MVVSVEKERNLKFDPVKHQPLLLYNVQEDSSDRTLTLPTQNAPEYFSTSKKVISMTVCPDGVGFPLQYYFSDLAHTIATSTIDHIFLNPSHE